MENEMKINFEVTINPDFQEVPAELERLFSSVDKSVMDTDEFFLQTVDLVKDLLVTAAVKMKMNNEEFELINPFTLEELNRINHRIVENWKGAIEYRGNQKIFVPPIRNT